MIYNEAEAAGAIEDLQDYLSWENHVLNNRISIAPKALSSLIRADGKGLKARDPAESGGILLGKTIPAEGHETAVIVDVCLVGAEGSKYNTTSKDKNALAEAVKAAHA